MTEEGPKDTEGKLDWSVFPFEEAEWVCKVFEFSTAPPPVGYGAPFTYRKGIPVGKLIAATIRHTVEIIKGNDLDAKTGLPHAAHIAANGLMLISQWIRKNREDACKQKQNFWSVLPSK